MHSNWDFVYIKQHSPLNIDSLLSMPFLAHFGMATRLDIVWELLLETVLSYREKVTSVYCTGHSLGGAYALVCVCKGKFVNGRQSACFDSVFSIFGR